jgi:hypothetical protein
MLIPNRCELGSNGTSEPIDIKGSGGHSILSLTDLQHANLLAESCFGLDANVQWFRAEESKNVPAMLDTILNKDGCQTHFEEERFTKHSPLSFYQAVVNGISVTLVEFICCSCFDTEETFNGSFANRSCYHRPG